MSSSIFRWEIEEKMPKHRRNSDTILINPEINNSDKRIFQNIRLSDLTTNNFNDLIFSNSKPEVAVSLNVLSLSHNSLLCNKINSKQGEKEFLKIMNEDLSQKRDSLSVFAYDFGSSQQSVFSDTQCNYENSNLLNVYDDSLSKSKNSLKVPEIEFGTKINFKPKSNINSRQNSLKEKKKFKRRFKSAPNTSARQIKTVVQTILPQNNSAKPELNYCQKCEIHRNETRNKNLAIK